MGKWTAADVEGLRAHIQEQGAALNHADAQGLCAYIAELEATIAALQAEVEKWVLRESAATSFEISQQAELQGAHQNLAASEATIARVRAAAAPVLHMAEAHHRRRFDITCDHDEDCHCDAEARSAAALSRLREALDPTPEGSDASGGESVECESTFVMGSVSRFTTEGSDE